MLDILQIGHLVFGRVVKAHPDKSAYLIMLTTGHLAILPKEEEDRPYKVGDNLAAAVSRIGDSHPILSQRSVHYIRKVADTLLIPLIRAQRVKIRGVASAVGAPFVKIAIEELTDDDPMGDCLKLLLDFKSYLTPTVVLVRFDSDLEAYITNALAPAPRNKIRRIVILHSTRSAQVLVETSSVRAFLGYKGLNVAVANKLVKRHIEIVGVT
ncbi:MAG: hypothetical protein AB1411_02625 [Nitrospirota bacterium]